MNVLAAFLYSFFLFWTTPSIAEVPRVTHFQAPRYPELAWQSQVHGKVTLKILVYKDGRFGFTETPEGGLIVSDYMGARIVEFDAKGNILHQLKNIPWWVTSIALMK